MGATPYQASGPCLSSHLSRSFAILKRVLRDDLPHGVLRGLAPFLPKQRTSTVHVMKIWRLSGAALVPSTKYWPLSGFFYKVLQPAYPCRDIAVCLDMAGFVSRARFLPLILTVAEAE